MPIMASPAVRVPQLFAALRVNQLQQQHAFKTEFLQDLLHLLPEEVWNFIIEQFVFPVQGATAYFCFERPGILWQDTYYLFTGTEKLLESKMALLKAEVAETVKHSLAIEDELLDTPMCTWCNFTDCEYCHRITTDGVKCCSHWTLIPFETAEEFNLYVITINIQGSYYGRVELRVL
jgi:hypothetical protein